MDLILETHIDDIMIGLLEATDYVKDGDLKLMRQKISNGLTGYKKACDSQKPETSEDTLPMAGVMKSCTSKDIINAYDSGYNDGANAASTGIMNSL